MPSRPANKSRLLSQEVFEEIERAIIDRSYPPGTHLVEDEVSAQMGVSRTPVREAFSMLERAGWLEIHPYAGAYVRQAPLKEATDIFELREALEGMAARLAGLRATDSQKRLLRTILEKGKKAILRGERKRYGKLNSEFHAAIADAARNRTLKQTLGELGKQVDWHFAAIAAVRSVDSWSEHDEIVDAIEAGDAKKAERLMVAHSRRSKEAFIEYVFSTEEVPAGNQ